jgi:hypothetical protein
MPIPQIARRNHRGGPAGTSAIPADMVAGIIAVPGNPEDRQSTECLAGDIDDLGHDDL